MRATQPHLVGHGHVGVSASFRRPTPGAEFDLLVNYLKRSLPMPEDSESLAVFIEPRVETGCPDAVAVYWRSSVNAGLSEWSALTSVDDRILQFVWLEGRTDSARIESALGCAAARRARELVTMGFLSERSAGLAVDDGGLVLSRLIAIEAKIGGPAAALAQAARNTWYASESYVLMPSLPATKALCDRYQACGVGIVTPSDEIASPSVPARKFGLPQSHLTWRFNRLALELSDSAA